MAKTTNGGKKLKASEAIAAAKEAQRAKIDALALVLTSKKALNDLLDLDAENKQRIDGMVGETREAIGNAVEKARLHKKAYADVKRFDKIKSNEDLARHWYTLIAYMEMRGLMKRIDSVEELPLNGKQDAEETETEAGEAEGETEAEAEAPAGEVVTPQFGGRGRRAPASTH